MIYFKTWQDAFAHFLSEFGHNYQDSYNLAAEFEQQLGRNRLGVYFLRSE
jgi:hypothetical protein